jgi:predicted O-linked N-acetylglucosamine transferase (SPINDLY family)
VEKVINLKILFEKKKYSELIFIIENKIPNNQKNSGILNILGACRLLKEKANKKNLSLALNDFREAYLKEDKTNHSKEAFVNFINISIKLFEYENSSENHNKSLKNFKEATQFFKKNKDYFSKDKSIILAITRVYKRLVNLKEVNICLELLLKYNNFTPFIINNYIYNNCFFKNWRQADFLKYGKLLEEHLPEYSKEKIIPLNKNKNKKIKLAFLSSDLFKSHPVTYFLKTILSNYNSQEFEIFLYHNIKKKDADNTTEILNKLVFKNCEIFDLSDIEVINLIRSDKIDIIIDLMGVTSKNRLSLIKNRVAPIQILWCGYCNTTGIKNMDYIIADHNVIFNKELNDYSEKIIYLPKIWNAHPGLNIERNFTDAPFLNNKFITFGSFNSFRKINETVINTWSKILKKIPNSKLLLKSSSVLSNNLILEKFKRNDVLKSVVFNPFISDFNSHMDLYSKIDIALDTFPYNGVTTSFEATWMGVPLLTIKGYNFNSRCGESINKNLDMYDLISENEKDYIDKAFKIATDNEKLVKIRKELFSKALTSPLFDSLNFSNEFFKSLKKLKSS